MEIQLMLSILVLTLAAAIPVLMAYCSMQGAKTKSLCLIRVTTSGRVDHFTGRANR